MILPDVNLLLHAYNAESPVHPAARKWWEQSLDGDKPVGLAWVAVLGFVRILTHRAVFDRPATIRQVRSVVEEWLRRSQVVLVEPGPRHAEILFDLLESVGSAGNLTTDAHLAALAIEHHAELLTTDADFARFPGVRSRNPLASASASRRR